MRNPFVSYTTRDSKYDNLPIYKLAKQFKNNLNILCLRNDGTMNENIYELDIDVNIIKNYTIKQVNISMFLHLRKNFWIISGDTLYEYFNNINFLDEELVLPLYYLKEKNIDSLMKLDNGVSNMQETMEIFQILDYTLINYM